MVIVGVLEIYPIGVFALIAAMVAESCIVCHQFNLVLRRVVLGLTLQIPCIPHPLDRLFHHFTLHIFLGMKNAILLPFPHLPPVQLTGDHELSEENLMSTKR